MPMSFQVVGDLLPGARLGDGTISDARRELH
jgi:hypothetical protein